MRISGKGLFFLEFSGRDGKVTIAGPRDELEEVLRNSLDLIEEDAAHRVDDGH